MKEEQKYNGSKTRNYFTAYLLASIRGKRLRYLEKQQKILFAEENLEDKEYTDADISPEERLELEQKEQLLMEEAQGIYPEWNEMTDISLIEAMFSLQEEERKRNERKCYGCSHYTGMLTGSISNGRRYGTVREKYSCDYDISICPYAARKV